MHTRQRKRGAPSFRSSANFSVPEQTNATISGALADPDGDGVPNLLEYALGLDPLTASGVGQPTITSNTGVLNLSYVRRADATDLNYTVEVSSAFTTWQSGPTHTREVSVTALDRLHERVVVADLTALSSVTKRFIRLRVTVAGSGPP